MDTLSEPPAPVPDLAPPNGARGPWSGLDFLVEHLGGEVLELMTCERDLFVLDSPEGFLHTPGCPAALRDGLTSTARSTLLAALKSSWACSCIAQEIDAPLDHLLPGRPSFNLTSVFELAACDVPDVDAVDLFVLCELDALRAQLSELSDVHPRLLSALEDLNTHAEGQVRRHGVEHGSDLLALLGTVASTPYASMTEPWVRELCPGLARPVGGVGDRQIFETFVDHHERWVRADADRLLPSGSYVVLADHHELLHGDAEVLLRSAGRLVSLLTSRRMDDPAVMPAALAPLMIRQRAVIIDPALHGARTDAELESLVRTVAVLLKDGTPPVDALQIALDLDDAG